MGFPQIITYRNHRAQIYVRPSRTKKYRTSWNVEGRRIERTFATLAEAKSAAKAALREIAHGQTSSASLTPNEVRDIRLAQNTLRELGVSVLDAVNEYAAAKRLMPDTDLAMAAKKWKDNTSEIKRAALSDVAREYLGERLGKIGKKTHYEEERRLSRVCEALSLDLCNLNKAALELFFSKELGGLSGKSRNHFRQTFRQLFKFAVRRDYLSSEHRLGEVLVNESTNEAAPEILEPEELRLLLEYASSEMLPYVAIAAFTGARRSEILRLRWENVWSIEGFMELESSKTKTRQRRLVPLSSALQKWLAPYRNCSGPVWSGGDGYFHSQCQKLMKDCRITGQNLLRHSYASYRLAQTSDPIRVATELGNSPEKLYTNYNKLRTPQQAEAWFAVLPQTDSKTIQAGVN